MEDLNARYNEERKAAAQEYARDILLPSSCLCGTSRRFSRPVSRLMTLFTKLREYSMAGESEKPAHAGRISQALSAGMDEGALTEYLCLDDADSVPAGQRHERSRSAGACSRTSTFLRQHGSVRRNRQTTSESHQDRPARPVFSMFGEALPEEVLKIATDLDMTGAQARWDEFAANPGAITTEAIITGLSTGRSAGQCGRHSSPSYTEVPEGASTAALTPEGTWSRMSTSLR